MKKIGIITLYKDSCNYGGLLQAFALTHLLRSMNYDAKQIMPGKRSNIYLHRSTLTKIKEHGCKYAIESLKSRIDNLVRKSEISESDLKFTRELCAEFRDEIPHTDMIDEEYLSKLDDEIDVFIVGSDQVWNPKWLRDIYLLKFTSKKKLAYAASMARFDFSEYEQRQLQEGVRAFDWVSVREQKAVDYLGKTCGISADLVLDPTMLFLRETWEQQEQRPKDMIENEKYIVCYYLKESTTKRVLAQKFAAEKQCKIVYPIWVGERNKYDDTTKGENILYHVGPREWLWLIHHAEYVLTDSFHGTVFSIIYEKEFYHVLRDRKKSNMNSRIYSLLDSFGLQDRLCEGNRCKDGQINYEVISRRLEDMRNRSVHVLESNL
ncbi:polysaccharide pyruvyl transferase family protein [Eubacterium sp. MSJ-33]|uniref:polysaccharide pyruvyl transferase family protein n=1 Tax=Eubacterium sp. MSJ-33 TaxID=2841528 RepID=UPI001C74B2E9|nr:polysaccharide pyruvyl transferase family protein [Eubacterium sp. MSJ-33]QWT54146.1 polysaccharide pyruvyl transferase family protein [Eubacterium sp. MSJ-33]